MKFHSTVLFTATQLTIVITNNIIFPRNCTSSIVEVDDVLLIAALISTTDVHRVPFSVFVTDCRRDDAGERSNRFVTAQKMYVRDL